MTRLLLSIYIRLVLILVNTRVIILFHLYQSICVFFIYLTVTHLLLLCIAHVAAAVETAVIKGALTLLIQLDEILDRLGNMMNFHD